MTTDSGKEFAAHEKLGRSLNVRFVILSNGNLNYFCDLELGFDLGAPKPGLHPDRNRRLHHQRPEENCGCEFAYESHIPRDVFS